MNKFEKVKLLLSKPFEIVNSGINTYSEDFYRKQINKRYSIDQLPTIDLLDLFPNFNEELCTYSYLDGTSFPTDIMLLKSLAKKFGECAYLEIGSWRGESISNVYDVTDDCTSITLSETEMRKMGISEEFIKVHGLFSRHLEKLKTIEHNSQTFDFSSLNKKFDLIFIDGDHSYKGVFLDTKNTFNLRKNKSSNIVWHDYGNSVEKVRYSVLAAILSGVPEEFHKNLYHVSNTICAIYLEDWNLDTSFTKFPTLPNKNFRINISGRKL